MKTKSFILSFFLLCFTLFANAENKEFEQYAKKQSQQMSDAYDKRDVKLYTGLLTDFLTKYDKLSVVDKKFFAPYLIDAYYNLGCTYALLNDKKNALSYIEKSIKAGYVDYNHITTDSDLESLHSEAAFISLTQPLRSVGDYMYIIKKAASYNLEDKRPLPTFTYQNADNPNLVTLRKTLNLDSIAGKGNDVSKVINLLYWIHNLVPHDGEHGNPIVKNALSMINECKRDSRGLNCRGLATVLNECYLSMGFKSRFVTCLPKDSLGIDNDCHVINMVYINALKKWVWMDPTFCAYVMNENGQLLSIEEVRERLINGKTLIINPDANWNHKASETKEYYLYNYMAKNLYRLECTANSQYDNETASPNKKIDYIQLLPIDYFKQSPDHYTSTNNITQVSQTFYNTNNPILFWATPEEAK